MTRLTKRVGENITYNQERKIECSVYCDECSQGTANCKTVREMIKKLADYEDAEEQGLLFKLPCKVGDIVYLVDFEENSYDVAVVESIELCVVEDKFEILLNSDYEIGTYAFADYVFYSQEGAEQASKKKESEG